MNKPKYVFSQLVAFMDSDKFRHLVDKYGGNRYVKHFTCWNQLLTLMFGQLSNRESMRDLIIAIEAHHQKCYHLGLGRHVTRSNLGKANTNRDYRIFEEYAYYLVSEARRKRATDIFKLDGNVYAFDSTTISLCLDVFWWAKFRKHKGGVKIHTLYDLEAQIPAFFHVTTASVHDSKVMKEIPLRQVLTTSLTVVTTTSRNSIAFIAQSRSLLSGLSPICSTSVSSGGADCPRECSQMLR